MNLKYWHECVFSSYFLHSHIFSDITKMFCILKSLQDVVWYSLSVSVGLSLNVIIIIIILWLRSRRLQDFSSHIYPFPLGVVLLNYPLCLLRGDHLTIQRHEFLAFNGCEVFTRQHFFSLEIVGSTITSTVNFNFISLSKIRSQKFCGSGYLEDFAWLNVTGGHLVSPEISGRGYEAV